MKLILILNCCICGTKNPHTYIEKPTHPKQCQIAAPRWLNDISSAADNAIFKNRLQNIECSFDCVARSAFLLKPNVANFLLCNFLFSRLSLPIFEEKFPNYASGPKSALNSDSFWVRRLFCAPNAAILLVYITAKIRMSFI